MSWLSGARSAAPNLRHAEQKSSEQHESAATQAATLSSESGDCHVLLKRTCPEAERPLGKSSQARNPSLRLGFPLLRPASPTWRVTTCHGLAVNRVAPGRWPPWPATTRMCSSARRVRRE